MIDNDIFKNSLHLLEKCAQFLPTIEKKVRAGMNLHKLYSGFGVLKD